MWVSHGKGRHTEVLRQNDLCGLVPHSRQAFECGQIGRDLATVIGEQDLRERPDSLGLARGQSARANNLFDLFHRQLDHALGPVGAGKERGRYLVDARIRALRRKQHGNEMRVGVPTFERDRGIGIEPLEYVEDDLNFGRSR